MSENTEYLGRYDLKRRVGLGGMGEVWLAYDRELDEEIALKFLIDSFDDKEAQILKRETKQARQLSHRNILRVYDFLIQPGERAAISMEYAPGGTLSELVNKERPVLEVAEVREWILQACEALTYAHEECGIVHRDIKPSNFMIGQNNRLKVADFGLSAALALHMDETSESVIGNRMTMHYASPQLLWNPFESHYLNDIYAMGVTIFTLLTGTYPFRDPKKNSWTWDPENLISMTAARERKGWGSEPIPDSWNYAVAKCLAEDPNDRPQSARELSTLLGGSNLPEPPQSIAIPYQSVPQPERGKASNSGSKKGKPWSRGLFIIILAAAIGLLCGILWGAFEFLQDRKASASVQLPVSEG